MRYLLAILFCLTFAVPAQAAEMKAVLDGPPTLAKDASGDYTLSLRDAAGKPITASGLREVHKSKVHLLVVDSSMTDYQHIHPIAARESFTFSFTPKTAHDYMAWADVTLKGGHHAYLPVPLKGTEACADPCIDLTPKLEGDAGGLHGVLSFDEPPRKGAMSMATLSLTADGKPVKDLEPVMGAFAHVVGFYTDRPAVVHLHPMGDEPTTDTARGGPDLMVHLEPETAGVIKLFAQVKRGGQDIFIPFTVEVK